MLCDLESRLPFWTPVSLQLQWGQLPLFDQLQATVRAGGALSATGKPMCCANPARPCFLVPEHHDAPVSGVFAGTIIIQVQHQFYIFCQALFFLVCRMWWRGVPLRHHICSSYYLCHTEILYIFFAYVWLLVNLSTVLRRLRSASPFSCGLETLTAPMPVSPASVDVQ